MTWPRICKPLRARINKEGILNRIDSIDFFLSVDLKSIRFGGKIGFGFIEKPRNLLEIL